MENKFIFIFLYHIQERLRNKVHQFWLRIRSDLHHLVRKFGLQKLLPPGNKGDWFGAQFHKLFHKSNRKLDSNRKPEQQIAEILVNRQHFQCFLLRVPLNWDFGDIHWFQHLLQVRFLKQYLKNDIGLLKFIFYKKCFKKSQLLEICRILPCQIVQNLYFR